MVADKYQIQEGQPYLLPHKCAGCNTDKNTEYIDLAVSIKRYGRLYLCIECFDEIATALDYSNPVSTKKLITDLISASDQINNLKDENAKFRDLIDKRIPSLRNDLLDLSYKPPTVVKTPRRSASRTTSTKQRIDQ